MLKRCCNTIANFSHTLLKKQATDEDSMISSNNYSLCVKCYINFYYIVPGEMESLQA